MVNNANRYILIENEELSRSHSSLRSDSPNVTVNRYSLMEKPSSAKKMP